ncbi:MAG: RNA polymerase sigma factor [bacterium]
MTINDQEYIDKVLAGDQSAFAVIVDQYKDLVFSIAIQMVKHQEEAEEVAQDTFIKVFKSLRSYKGDSKFSTWIYRVAYNTSLDRIKKNKRKQQTYTIDEFTENQVKDMEDALDILEVNERNKAVEEVMKLLHPDDSTLLNLFYFEELSLDEIGKIMYLKPNNVKVKLFRARKRLATLMRKQLDKEILKDYDEAYRGAVRQA